MAQKNPMTIVVRAGNKAEITGVTRGAGTEEEKK
jgi:hypothetical protein